jgi:hypothetical protein
MASTIEVRCPPDVLNDELRITIVIRSVFAVMLQAAARR